MQLSFTPVSKIIIVENRPQEQFNWTVFLNLNLPKLCKLRFVFDCLNVMLWLGRG